MKGKKGTQPDCVPFDHTTIAAYRKLAKYKDRLEDYYEQTDDVPTQTDFLKQVTLSERDQKEQERER